MNSTAALNQVGNKFYDSCAYALGEIKDIGRRSVLTEETRLKTSKILAKLFGSLQSDAFFTVLHPTLGAAKSYLSAYVLFSESLQFTGPGAKLADNYSTWQEKGELLKVASCVCLVAGLLFAPINLAYALGFAPFGAAIAVGTYSTMTAFQCVGLSLIWLGSFFGLLDKLGIFREKTDRDLYAQQLINLNFQKKHLELHKEAIGENVNNGVFENDIRLIELTQKWTDLKIEEIKMKDSYHRAQLAHDVGKVSSIALAMLGTFWIPGLLASSTFSTISVTIAGVAWTKTIRGTYDDEAKYNVESFVARNMGQLRHFKIDAHEGLKFKNIVGAEAA